MPKFFRFPWASTGDKTAIPDETDAAGFVSYQQGYGNDYARDPASDPLAKLIERDKMNQLYSDLTENAQYWQIHAFPEYITAAQNGGVEYAYDIGAVVRWTDNKNYRNTVAGNTKAPNVSGWVLYNNPADAINSATAKTTPVDADQFGIADSAASNALKKLTWANVKATILSSFGVMINSATAKTTPVDADIFIIADSAATNASKKLTWANVKTALTSVFAPIASPAFTGTPTAPTAAAGTNTTQIATTAYVDGKFKRGTAVASTSGTYIDFTGIPSWAKRITVMFNGVSTNGGSNFLIQIGSGSIQTTGYIGEMGSAVNFSSGFQISYISASETLQGHVVLTNFSGNTWIESSVTARNALNSQYISAGTVTLSGTLDRVRITTVNGTDTFDAGAVNIMWEG